jgi:phospholipase D-like protein
MRNFGERNGITCKVYAGTNTTLLAMDLASPDMREGLLGFAIHRTRLDGRASQPEPLKNLLHFESSGLAPGKAAPSTQSPYQKFRWADYGAQPGARYHYRADAFYGTPDRPRFLEGPPIEVKLHGPKDDHYVVFNRAVVASQAFWRKLPEWLGMPQGAPIPKIRQGDELPAEAYKWLSRGAEEAITDFIKQGENDSCAIDIAIYEYEWPALAQAVAKAAAAGAHIRLLFHGKPDSKELKENKATLRKFPVNGPNVELIARTPSKLMHNKFIVFSKIERGERKPKAVLSGSTNWTENGLFRQANVVHVCRVADVAARYDQLFNELVRTAASAKDTRTWISENIAIDIETGIFCGFSPRTGLLDIKDFVRIVDSVERDVLFATAFDIHDDIENSLIGTENDPILRLGVQNKASGLIGAVNRDRTDSFVTPALFGTDADDWFKQRGSAGQRGSLYIHLKAIVTDFTSNNPTVISGSHNLSKGASDSNDENYMVMRGSTDLADVYGVEILRFFDHYRFRHFLRELQSQSGNAPRNTLVEDNTWTDRYFDRGSLHEAERLQFAGR